MLAGLVYCLIWRTRRRERLIPPPRRHRHIPWTGPELTLVLLIYVILPFLAMWLLTLVGVLAPVADPNNMTTEEFKPRIVVNLLISPFIVILSLMLLKANSFTKPRHVGFTLWRWRNSLTLGYICFLIMTPMVLGIQFISTVIMKWEGITVQEHPLLKIGGPHAEPWVLCVIPLQVMIAAPVVEEFVFRGVMLPWLSQRWWGGWSAMAAAIVIGLSMVEQSRAPLAFALVISLLGIAFTFPHRGEQWARRAIIGTSVLFAMVHANVWPTPIPLLVLGLALGWAAHRTRSLIAPITLHALFNGVATLMLLTGFPPQTKGKAETSAATRSEPASISTAVPGVWWPCRK